MHLLDKMTNDSLAFITNNSERTNNGTETLQKHERQNTHYNQQLLTFTLLEYVLTLIN